MKKLLFALSLIASISARAQLERIQSIRFDRSQVKSVHLAPGLGSMILFPCALVEVFVGRSEDLKAQISPTDKKLLYLNLKLNSSFPTNMIAKCELERNVFVFDVIPSKTQHQDLVDIRGIYGRLAKNDLKPIEASNPMEEPSKEPLKRIVLENPVLIDKASSK